MTEAQAAATLSGGVALLERAISYSLCQLNGVTTATLSRPTPCTQWDLAALLVHVTDSLAALQEAMDLREVEPPPDVRDIGAPGTRPGALQNDPAAYLVAALRRRACHLLGSLAIARDHLVLVGGYPVPASIVTSAGAVDVAVHGWDIGCACGAPAAIPEELAQEMLRITPLLVTSADRPEMFAHPVPVADYASASDRLVGYLGRSPAQR
ncbi:MAG TPA: TIGR03086 family metal-binding protein [Streptosporangiaceae bacterium]|jgi:uncharacterized protein (TIGR03086 family)